MPPPFADPRAARAGTTLPEPDAHARAASLQLSRLIADRIRDAGGWIGFDAFMAAALYEPRLGYYAGGAAKFGAAGDFVTAPGLSAEFGASVAVQLAQWFDAAPGMPRRVVEFGAGDGSLAADVLIALGAGAGGEGREPASAIDAYAIVELSGELRARQRDTIARRLAAALGEAAAAAALAKVCWWDALPASIEGCVIGNELLDAMPVRLFRVHGGKLWERGVALAGEDAQARSAAGPVAATTTPAMAASATAEVASQAPAFAFADRPADAAFEAAVGAALDGAMPGWREAATDPGFDYVSEWPEQAHAWVASVGARLARGALLLVDYGFARAELYHPQRRGGTLMCHRAHHAHPDPFDAPGLTDITAHVDFSAVAQAGEAAGLALAGYTTQAHFLIATGLLERLARVPRDDARAYARAAHAAQRLLSEAEMGELFKAIALTRGIDAPAVGFSRGDRSGRL